MAKTDVILADLKTAMKLRQAEKVSTLRLLVAALNNARIEKQKDLNDEETDLVLKKEVKKRQEAIELYQRGKRPELVLKETAELNLIKTYLPEGMTEEQVKQAIIEVLKTVPERNFGAVMKLAMAKLQGQADGKMVAKLVQEAL